MSKGCLDEPNSIVESHSLRNGNNNDNCYGSGSGSRFVGGPGSFWIKLDQQTEIHYCQNTIMVIYKGTFPLKSEDVYLDELSDLLGMTKDFGLEIKVPTIINFGQGTFNFDKGTFIFFENFNRNIVRFSDLESGGSVGIIRTLRKTVLKIRKRH